MENVETVCSNILQDFHEERRARRKASTYKGQHNTETRGQTLMYWAVFEPTVPTPKWPEIHALESTATASAVYYLDTVYCSLHHNLRFKIQFNIIHNAYVIRVVPNWSFVLSTFPTSFTYASPTHIFLKGDKFIVYNILAENISTCNYVKKQENTAYLQNFNLLSRNRCSTNSIQC